MIMLRNLRKRFWAQMKPQARPQLLVIMPLLFSGAAFAATCPESDEIHLQSAHAGVPTHYVTESGWSSSETTAAPGSNIQFDRVLIGFSSQVADLSNGDIHACSYTLDGGDTPYNVIHMVAPASTSASLNNVSEWLDISTPGIVDIPAATVYICPSAALRPSVTSCQFTLTEL